MPRPRGSLPARTSRFRTFQWVETGIFLALALAPAGGCIWWLIRRVT